MILFSRFRIAGFGPYRDTIICNMSPGINTLVGKNETGKSSLVAGLVTTIFGLPTKNDPQEFGRARFKNWYGPVRFEGELDFQVNGVKYSIWRDFESHKISLSLLENGVKRNLVSGEHNPNAQKRNIEYESTIKEIFGMDSRELFEATFCVTQPLPESIKRDGLGQRSLDKDVQELLSGTKITFTGAQAILLDELKNQTKFTKARGITTRDQRKDGNLEKLKDEINTLKTNLQETKGLADSLEVMRARLNSLTKKLTVASKELEMKQKIKNSLAEWRRLKSEYDQAIRDLVRIKDALKDAETNNKKIITEEKELENQYPGFLTILETIKPEAIDDDLDKLIYCKQGLIAIDNRINDITSQSAVNKNEIEQIERSILSLRKWDRLGKSPASQIQALQLRTSGLLNNWKIFKTNLKDKLKCDEVLKRELALIENATEEEQNLLASYDITLAKLEKRLSDAERDFQEIESMFVGFEKDSLEFHEKYKDIESFTPDVSSMLSEKIQLMNEEIIMATNLEKIKKRMSPPTWVRIACMLIFAGSAFSTSGILLNILNTGFLMGSFSSLKSTILMGLSIVLGIAGWFISGPFWVFINKNLKRKMTKFTTELNSIESKLQNINTLLGDETARLDQVGLGRLQERLTRRQLDKNSLLHKKNHLPSDEKRKEIRNKYSSIKNEYEAFLERTRIFAREFPSIATAYAKWNDITRKKNNVFIQATLFAKHHFGCTPDAVFECGISSENVSPEWKEIFNIVKIAEKDPNIENIGEFISFIENLDGSWWLQIQKEAEQYEKLQKEKETLSIIVDNQTRQLNNLKQDKEKLNEYYNKIRTPYIHILEDAENDPKILKTKWSGFKAQKSTIHHKKILLAGIFNNYKVKSLDELNYLVTQYQTNAVGAETRWKKLIDEKPGLPQIKDAEDPVKINEYTKLLSNDIQVLEGEVKKLEVSLNDCRYKLSIIERENPLNIARTELELKEAEARYEDAKLQADALTEAYLELGFAIQDFHTSYRVELEKTTMKYFQKITKRDGRFVRLGDDFHISLDVDGRPCDIAQLSKGAQDQLYIALRLAIADLLSTDVNVPLIFDDPFVTCDNDRLENLGNALNRISKERQILILSHNEVFSKWGQPVKISEISSK